ncbi:hypothetical protein [Microbacterium sp. NPDC096154]|uniref:hypothetical protein n=1 Tax=Microbacterium sp. NPDC096154 TaxID=3155549 RepID=UPI00332A962B
MSAPPPVTPDERASSALRTHQHLRLSLVLLIAVLLLAVAIQTVVVSWQPLRLGWNLLPSISHYFYTPARWVFISVLVGAALALLALSGRRGPTVALDIAAIFAPVIAVVPPGVLPGTDGGSDGITCVRDDCIPTEVLADVRASVATYGVAVILVVVVMGRVRRRQTVRATRGHLIVSAVAVASGLALALLAFAPGASRGFPFNIWPIPSVHFAAVLLFFAAFTAVPLFYGWRPAEPDETPPTPWQAGVYRLVTWLMAVDVLFLAVALLALEHGWTDFAGAPVVLIGEALALILFAWFWWEQTLQRWNDEETPFLIPPA